MSVELILGGVGTFLGVANFVYWVWWAKREKITILEHRVYTRILTPDEGELSLSGEITKNDRVSLSITVSCLIMLLKGQNTEIRDVNVRFNEYAFTELSEYFQMPLSNRINLNTEESYKEGNTFAPISLQSRKSVYLVNKLHCASTPKFGVAYAQDDVTQAILHIRLLLKRLESNYNVSWVRYNGRIMCWRLPDKWWCNLGKKLWG